jgi:cytoskeleton protein RodZ
MSSTPFGEHLKREREMRGVSLEEISAATRISTRFLEAIEGEHWDQLPGGVFNRGFIRAIARFLGLDEDSLVAEYAIETRDTAPPRIAPEYSGDSRRIPWAGILVALVVLAALVAGSWFVVVRYGARIGAFLHGHRNSSAAAEQKPALYSDMVVAHSDLVASGTLSETANVTLARSGLRPASGGTH